MSRVLLSQLQVHDKKNHVQGDFRNARNAGGQSSGTRAAAMRALARCDGAYRLGRSSRSYRICRCHETTRCTPAAETRCAAVLGGAVRRINRIVRTWYETEVIRQAMCCRVGFGG